jgi:YopT peptidase
VDRAVTVPAEKSGVTLAQEVRGMGIVSSMMFKTARQNLAEYGGVMTWDFSQYNWGVWKILSGNSASRGGICKSLSAQWIIDHAHGGSLFNRVLDRSGKLNEGAIRIIRQHFIGARGEQEGKTAEFLRKWGLLERMSSRNNSSSIPSKKSTFEQGFGDVALGLSKELSMLSGCYAQIGFGKLAGLGHATAAWVGSSGGDACFFDPNAGEFYFEDKRNLFRWFVVFYATSYQGFPLYYNGRWSVRQWALANNANKKDYAKVLSVAGRR